MRKYRTDESPWMNIFYAVLKDFDLLKSVMFTTAGTENVKKVS